MIRNVGGLLVKGFKPRDILTQYMARYTSPTQGKDGTSHFHAYATAYVIHKGQRYTVALTAVAGMPNEW